jgi:hypothetical protein
MYIGNILEYSFPRKRVLAVAACGALLARALSKRSGRSPGTKSSDCRVRWDESRSTVEEARESLSHDGCTAKSENFRLRTSDNVAQYFIRILTEPQREFRCLSTKLGERKGRARHQMLSDTWLLEPFEEWVAR